MQGSKIQNRALSLDALRGFAILTMVLSGVIPYHVLPAWMYHAQVPPPDHTFNPNLPGMTWVDLVFPMFLFALGTAIPLALGGRLKKDASYLKTVIHVLSRGFLLGFFAIFLRHVRPHVINSNPDTGAWLIGLAGFFIMFAIFVRPQKSWKQWQANLLKYGGWVLAAVLLIFIRYPDDSGFSLYRSDIIIIVLTNVYVFGSLIWLCTQKNHLLRLGVLGIYLGLRLSHADNAVLDWLWNASPAPWIYKLDYLKYLFIVIPGTIAGDLFAAWMERKPLQNEQMNWSKNRLWLLISILAACIIFLLTGLQNRWIWQTMALVIPVCILLMFLIRNASASEEKLIKQILNMGIYWLITGLIFEPFEGGIKKDPSTLGYYFITTGMSIFLLTTFFIIADILQKGKWLAILVRNGQNPLIAYTGVANFIWPVFALTTADIYLNAITASPWLGFLRGVFYTTLLALMVNYLSRKKIFWKT